MRAVVVAPGPEFSVMDVYRGWCKGLRQNGVKVHEFNLHDRLNFFSRAEFEIGGEYRKALSFDGAVAATLETLMSTMYEAWPDILIFTSGFFMDNDLVDKIRTRGHKTVMLHTESPYEEDRQLAIASRFDVNVLNDPINLDLYPPGTIYVPHAHDPDVHHPNGRSDEYDFAFVGTGYPSRQEFFEKVDFGSARAALDGNWQNTPEESPLTPLMLHRAAECMDNGDTADLYRSAAMSANLYRGADPAEAERPELTEGWAMGPREVELAACGTFFAREPRGEGDTLFPMLPTITEPGELTDVIRWSMDNPDERQQAADAARAAVADRTFESNARHLLSALGV